MPGRDLFVSTYSPRLGNGRDLRTYTVVRALAAHGPLDLLYVPHGGPPSPEYAAIDGLVLHEVVPSRGLSRGLMAARVRAQGWWSIVARSCSVEVRDAALALAAAPGRGRVIAGDLNAMAMLMGLARRRPVVYNAHNVESDYGRNPYVGRFHYLPVATLERRVLRVASESWMVSRLDVGKARELAPSATLRYAPNVVDVRAVEPVRPPAEGGVALMVADYTYAPNRQGVEWLLAEVLPRVWAQRPEARVRLAGRGLELPDPDPRVEVTGFVDVLRDAYSGAAAVVVPLLEGAGTPLKFLEALAYGVPVVATPRAARGLDAAEAGVHFREGADAEAFAAQLVELLRDGDAEMAARGRGLVEAEYSVEALARLLAPGAPLA